MRTLNWQHSLLLFLVSAALNADPRAPEVRFDMHGVQVGGARPRSRVAYLGLVRDAVGHHVEIRVVSGIQQATNEGSLAVAETKADASHALWLICDVDAGTFTRARPSGYVTSSRPIGIDAIPEGQSFVVQTGEAKILYVRPRVGAWTVSSYDGGARDADRTMNGSVVVAMESLRDLGDGVPPPETIHAGDLVLVIDTLEMRSWQMEVAP